MGKVIYSVTKAQLKRIKKCAKYARLNWEQIAARPSTADEFCERVEKEMKVVMCRPDAVSGYLIWDFKKGV